MPRLLFLLLLAVPPVTPGDPVMPVTPGIPNAQVAPTAEGSATTWILCGRLLAIPGAEVALDQVVVVEGERIAAVRPREGGAAAKVPDGVRVVDLSDAFVLPGLIDCHTHLSFQMSANTRLERVTTSEADAALMASVYARRTLEAGFTTVRDVGSNGDTVFALRDAVERGAIVGPRILTAGHAITPTGGHGDFTHGYREGLFPAPGVDEGVCDGADECRKAVRAQVKRGADLIKLTATGGVLSDTAAGTDRQFFDDELAAIVATAHLLGRKVAAHAHGIEGIRAALRAGVDSIEHGSCLDRDGVALFLETGAFLVPTMLAGATVAEQAEVPGYFTPAVAAKARLVGPMVRTAVLQAARGGVRIAFGTDSGVSEHGRNAREFALLVAAGMSPMDTLVAATRNAAELLGMSDRIGTLEPGKYADLVAVRGDPLADVRVLEQTTFVMKGGAVALSR